MENDCPFVDRNSDECPIMLVGEDTRGYIYWCEHCGSMWDKEMLISTPKIVLDKNP